jgi:hypothetical protein
MAQLFDLSENIVITQNLVSAIGRGCPPSPDMPDPIASIQFMTPADNRRDGYWVLGWASKKFVPAHAVQRVAGIELFLSEDVQSKLRGKIIDIENGKIIFFDLTPSTNAKNQH